VLPLKGAIALNIFASPPLLKFFNRVRTGHGKGPEKSWNFKILKGYEPFSGVCGKPVKFYGIRSKRQEFVMGIVER